MTGSRRRGRRWQTRIGIAFALAVAVSTVACAGSEGVAPTPVATAHVDLPRSYRFAPEAIMVPAGTTVTWTNSDNFSHSVRFLDDDGDQVGEPLVMEPGASVEFTFDEPGVHRYDCSFHPHDMQGTVTVSAD